MAPSSNPDVDRAEELANQASVTPGSVSSSEAAELVASPEPKARERAAEALAEVAKEYPEEVRETVPDLKPLLDNAGDSRGYAAYALVEIAKEYPEDVRETVPDFQPLLDGENERLRLYAVFVLAKIAREYPEDVRGTVPKLQPLLGDDAEDSQKCAAAALKRVAREYPEDVRRTVPDLHPLLNSEDEGLRRRAADALAKIAKEYPGDVRSTVADLHSLLGSEDDGSQGRAAEALAGVAKEYPEDVREAVPDLRPLLSSEYERVRRYAASTLAKIAREYPEDVRETVPDLQSLLDDDDEDTANYAAEALTEIAKGYFDDIRETAPDLQPRYGATHDTPQAADEATTPTTAVETGGLAIETRADDRAWGGVDVQIAPVSEDATSHTDDRTVTTDSEGRHEVQNLPPGEYDVSVPPRPDGIETTAAIERATIRAGKTTDVTLAIEISYSISGPNRNRLTELQGRIEKLTTATDRDMAIPRYYGTVLRSMLGVVEEIEAFPERTAEAGLSPDATVEAVLEATDAGLAAVNAAMAERRTVRLLEAAESLPDTEVTWGGAATLGALLDRVGEGADHERLVFRNRLNEVDDFLNQWWSEVTEIAPARKLHAQLEELVQEIETIDDELAVVAHVYLGLCLLDAVEELFEHDSLKQRLNSITY